MITDHSLLEARTALKELDDLMRQMGRAIAAGDNSILACIAELRAELTALTTKVEGLDADGIIRNMNIQARLKRLEERD